MKDTIRLSGVIAGSVVDGPGYRFVIFVQGCPHHCKGCHNPTTWDYDKGIIVSIDKLIDLILQNAWCDAITLSGGEPLEQAEELCCLLDLLKKRSNKTYNILTYTGYVFENIYDYGSEFQKKLILNSDYVIDGPFIESEKSLDLKFRGSNNQRILEPKNILCMNSKVNLNKIF